MQHRNIARLLFSYLHFTDNNIYSNLVDLNKVFSPPYDLDGNPTIQSLEKGALESFLPTISLVLLLQKNPLWQGMLDIVKAVHQLHGNEQERIRFQDAFDGLYKRDHGRMS